MSNLQQASNYFVPMLISRFTLYLQRKRTDPRGRKRSVNLSVFFNLLIDLADGGSKGRIIVKNYIPKSTFFYYLRLLADSDIISTMRFEQLHGYYIPKLQIIDSFLVKSIMGREGTGPNPTDRGRRGIKNTLISDKYEVILHDLTSPANKSENSALTDMLENIQSGTTLLADAGYVGAQITQKCEEHGIHLVSNPRKIRIGQRKKVIKGYTCASCLKGDNCTNGKCCKNSSQRTKTIEKGYKMSHELSQTDKRKLSKHRWVIEATNAHIRNFRAVNLKMVRKIGTYRCILGLCILFHNHRAMKRH